MTNLTDLLSRTKEAVGADRELDAAVAEYIGEGPGEGWTLIKQDNPRVFNMDAGRWIKGGVIRTPKPYSASTDAALALVERLAPDLVIKMTRVGDGSGHFQVVEAWFAESGVEVIDDMSPLDPKPGAIAILVALLTALTTIGDSHE